MSRTFFTIPELVEMMLLSEVFSPIELLTKSRLVCKSWKAIIEDSPAVRYYTATGMLKDAPFPATSESRYSQYKISDSAQLTPISIHFLTLSWRRLLRVKLNPAYKDENLNNALTLLEELNKIFHDFIPAADQFLLFRKDSDAFLADVHLSHEQEMNYKIKIGTSYSYWDFPLRKSFFSINDNIVEDKAEYEKKFGKKPFMAKKESKISPLTHIMTLLCHELFNIQPLWIDYLRWSTIKQSRYHNATNIEDENSQARLQPLPTMNLWIVYGLDSKFDLEHDDKLHRVSDESLQPTHSHIEMREEDIRRHFQLCFQSAEPFQVTVYWPGR